MIAKMVRMNIQIFVKDELVNPIVIDVTTHCNVFYGLLCVTDMTIVQTHRTSLKRPVKHTAFAVKATSDVTVGNASKKVWLAMAMTIVGMALMSLPIVTSTCLHATLVLVLKTVPSRCMNKVTSLQSTANAG